MNRREEHKRLKELNSELLAALVGIRSWAEGPGATTTEQLIQRIAERAIAKATGKPLKRCPCPMALGLRRDGRGVDEGDNDDERNGEARAPLAR